LVLNRQTLFSTAASYTLEKRRDAYRKEGNQERTQVDPPFREFLTKATCSAVNDKDGLASIPDQAIEKQERVAYPKGKHIPPIL
jgi:hypothetical protein